jgi:hypothetical protein
MLILGEKQLASSRFLPKREDRATKVVDQSSASKGGVLIGYSAHMA